MDRSERVDYGHLPIHYQFTHLLCLKFHDAILEDLLSERFATESQYKFQVETQELPVEGEHIIDWLTKHGLGDEANNVLAYELIRGLLSDFCQFVLASLKATAHMQISVAYTLLRKPFLEVLLMLEQLLCNEKSFMQSFAKSSDNFDPTTVPKEKKKELIKDSISRLSRKDMYDAQRIYDLRYDSQSTDSLFCMTNMANHIVTTRHPLFKTERQNLNLVFLNDDDFESNLDYIYFFIPYLLHYAVEVVEGLLTRKRILTEEELKYRQLIRFIGFSFFMEQSPRINLTKETPLDVMSGNFSVSCPECKKDNLIFKSDMFTFFNDEIFGCKFCMMPMTLDEEALKLLYKVFII